METTTSGLPMETTPWHPTTVTTSSPNKDCCNIEEVEMVLVEDENHQSNHRQGTQKGEEDAHEAGEGDEREREREREGMQ